MLIASLVKLHLPLHETCFLFRQGCSKKGKMSFNKPKPNFGIGMFINIITLHRVLVISNFGSILNDARQNKCNVDVLHLFSATFKSSENSDPLAFWCNHQQPLSHPPSGGRELAMADMPPLVLSVALFFSSSSSISHIIILFVSVILFRVGLKKPCILRLNVPSMWLFKYSPNVGVQSFFQ